MKLARCYCMRGCWCLFVNGRRLCVSLWVTGALLLFFASLPAQAQLTTQHIPLSPGWNAVFLEVTPEQTSCGVVFRGLPLDSVWRWNPKTSTVQFVQDPSNLAPEDPDWLVYFPQTSAEHALTTLHAIHGGHPYLINLRGALPVTLRVKGVPSLQSVRWQADSFNLVGFSVSASQGPTFQSFFASSPAHTGQAMYRMSASGRWEQITNPGTARLEQAQAYWVYCSGQSVFQGPMRVTVDQGRGINFSDLLVESQVHIDNESSSARTVTLHVNDSQPPDSGAYPVRAGGVALSFYKTDYANEDVGWREFNDAVTVTVPARTRHSVRLAVRRADLAPYMPAGGDEDYNYQSLLTIEDNTGVRLVMPVSARSIQSAADKAGGVHVRSGLWVGIVSLDKVSELVPMHASEGPQPTASEFQFKILIHVDAQGTARLLRHVTQLWRPGTYMPDPDNPAVQVVDRPGEYVLFTELAKIDEYLQAGKLRGAVLRDGTPAGRRVSTSIFGFNEPLQMTGSLPTPPQPTATLACTVVLEYDDPRNPFMHRYHPDHNNLRPDYETMLDEGIESWTVTRHLTLDFTAADPEFPEGAQAGWGDARIGGVYLETIEGLHRQDITVQGVFRLRRVSNIVELNPDL